jgi:hypothetical protein
VYTALTSNLNKHYIQEGKLLQLKLLYTIVYNRALDDTCLQVPWPPHKSEVPIERDISVIHRPCRLGRDSLYKVDTCSEGSGSRLGLVHSTLVWMLKVNVISPKCVCVLYANVIKLMLHVC